MIAKADHRLTRLRADGSESTVGRALAVETPIAIEINGIGYAVLMASPMDLVDLAYGFLWSESLATKASDIEDVAVEDVPLGAVVRVTAHAEVAERLSYRVRHRTTDASCGLCGIENLEQALRPLPAVPQPWRGDDAAVFRALAQLDAWQPINRATRAVHGAARCSPSGNIIDVREDVGRHNAFDKLIGAMLRAGASWDGGFALLTSRCSYELVEKAVIARCPMLATISAPTDLAVRRAAEAGLELRPLARPDAIMASGAS